MALELPADYYHGLADRYRERREFLVPALEAAGFRAFRPRGAYYVMTDISEFGFDNDVEFARHLVETWAWPRCRGRASIPIQARDATGCGSISHAVARHLKTLRNGSAASRPVPVLLD